MPAGFFYSFLLFLCFACASGEPRPYMEIITTPTDRDVTAQSEVGVGDGGTQRFWWFY